MKPVNGLYRDCNPQDQPANTYRFAKNMVDNKTVGGLENEDGFTDLGVLSNGTVIGLVTMRNKVAIFSINEGVGQIGYATRQADNSLVYTAVYSSADLEFNINYPIKGEYQVNLRGEDIVAWVDGINPPRIINLTNPQVSTVNDLSVFLSATPPQATITLQDSGGSLLTSSVYLIVQYEDEDGGSTSWFGLGQPVSIYDDNSGQVKTDGAPAGTPTSKSIRLDLSGVDTTFSKINVGVVQLKGGVVSAFQIQQLSTKSTMTFIYTGAETVIDISLEDVLVPGATYVNAKAITQINNQLILGNLTSSTEFDFQAVANKIKIDYTWSLVSNIVSNVDATGGFQSGEVYAFYIILDLPSGASVAYHIPGRGPRASDLLSDNVTIRGVTAKRYQIVDTSAAGGAITNMGYWENETELYPTAFPVGYSWDGNDEVLANQKVRHHRFPDMASLITRHGGGNLDIGKNSMLRLGINASNVIIPEEIKAQITGWRIGYAKRSYNNSIVLGTDMLHLAAKSQSGSINTLYLSSGGNWEAGFRRLDSGNRVGAMTITTDGNGGPMVWDGYARGHCLDLLFDKPDAVASYAHVQYKLKVPQLQTVYSTFGGGGGRVSPQSFVVDATSTFATRVDMDPGQIGTRLDEFAYLDQNQASGNWNTLNTEGIIRQKWFDFNTWEGLHPAKKLYAGTSEPFLWLTGPRGGDYTGWEFDTPSGPDLEETYVYQYRRIPSNVYVTYDAQTLVSLPKRVTNLAETSLTNIFGGDIFLTPIQFITTADPIDPIRTDSETSGVRIFRLYVGEARHNWKLRHEDTTVDTKYFPKSDPSSFQASGVTLIGNLTTVKNKVAYNTDYDQKAEYLPALIIGDETQTTGDELASTTIIYSEVQNLENKDVSWRSFPVGNRYVQPRNRGPITNLQGWRNKELIIHHEDAIFITRTNLSLAGDVEDVRLKSTELFEIAPQEVLTIEGGYAGTRHPLACKVTKLGYCFVDDKRKKIFSFDGEQLKEISNQGLRTFFRTTGLLEIETDNAYNGNGYTMAFDETANRLLIGKQQGNTSFTISYSAEKQAFISFHDYFPNAMFNLDTGLVYSIRNNKFYLHQGGAKGVFYDPTPKASLIEFVANANSTEAKVFTTAQWNTQVRSSTGNLLTSTFSHILFRTIDKTTGKQLIQPITNINNFDQDNVREYGYTWSFNNIYDISTNPDFVLGFYANYEIDATKLNNNLPWFKKRKFIDKYVTCRLEHSNEFNTALVLLDADVLFRLSTRP